MKLTPAVSAHGKKWVYATKDIVVAALFVSPRGGDFTCQVGRDSVSGTPYVCERFAGAFEHRYSGAKGSIYVLPGARFKEGMTAWDEEVVCREAVEPLDEIRIGDAAEYLLRLSAEGRLMIVHYPEKVAGIPEDDEDLVDKAASWARTFGARVLDQLRAYHPHLVPRVLERLERDSSGPPHHR